MENKERIWEIIEELPDAEKIINVLKSMEAPFILNRSKYHQRYSNMEFSMQKI